MKKLVTSLMLVVGISWCLPGSFAQVRRRKRDAVFIGGGANTGARHRRPKRSRGSGTTVRRAATSSDNQGDIIFLNKDKPQTGTTTVNQINNKAEPGQTVPYSVRNGRKNEIIGGAGGAGSLARNRRGRWVTRNGKRIWVPQGAPMITNKNSNR